MVFDVKRSQGKWNASFVTILFHIAKIKCSSIRGIDMMAMGEMEFQCVQGTSMSEGPICPIWWTCPSTTK
jgi:hypothetical protein